MSELPSLIVEVEARINKLEQGLKKANALQNRAATQMEQRAKQSALKMEQIYGRMTSNVGAGFKKMIGPALAIAGIASVTQLGRKVQDLAEEYRGVENTLKAIGQTGDVAVEKLAGAAIRSGADLSGMGQTIMRIQKATNGGYDETIRRVETLNKLLTVGGASTSEQNSVSLQLSQALSSGVLQGDELRSLREAAPVELLDAIAKAAGGTRDQLKNMGAEGKLTSAVVLKALDEMAGAADTNFGKMTMTSDRAMTNLGTGLTTFVGRLDEGLGASERMATGISNLGVYLNNNAAAAEQFGLSVVAAFDTFQQIADDAEIALEAMGKTIRQSAIGPVFDLAAAFGDTGLTIGEVLDAVVQGLATFNGAMEGSAMAVAEAFAMIPDAISGAMEAALNGVISGVEAMINRVLEGLRVVAQAVDTLTAKIPGTDGTNLAAGIGNVALDRVSGLKTNYSNRSVSDAYAEGAASGEKAVLDAAGSVGDFFNGIKDRFDENRARLEAEAAADDDKRPATKDTPDAPATGSTSSGGGRGGGGGAAKLNDFTQAAQEIREKTLALQAEAAALAEVTGAELRNAGAMDLARTKAELLNAATRAGVTDTPALRAQIDQLASEYVKAGAAVELAADKIEEVQNASRAGAERIASVFEGMATGALNAKQAVGQLILELLKMALQKRIMEAAGLAGGSIFGKVLGFLGGGFSEGGYTGHGSKNDPAGVVHKGEYVMSKSATSAIGVGNLEALHQSALRGYSGGGLVGAARTSATATMGRASAAAPTIEINAPITVNASGGTPDQNADLAKQMAREMEQSMRGVVVSELSRQMRPGAMLSRNKFSS
tara:strand:- start:128964 stop:131456 length:2493 start_codon:yes stop_codon:yes gene_type:complete